MLERYLKEGIVLTELQLIKLNNFAAFLQEYNEKVNLTAITDTEDIHIKHFMDSIKGEKFFPIGANVMEVGSGGGFPSIPLKIVREDLSFTLLESTGKKCGFLRSAVELLELDRMTVLNGRAEESGRKAAYRENYDVCCARAVARLNTLSEYCLPFVRPGGRFIAYKGNYGEELKEALAAVEILGGKPVETEEYELAGKRSIIVIEKVQKTPEKYPRGKGLERRSPL